MKLDELAEHPFEVIHASQPPGSTRALYGIPGGNFRSISRRAERMGSSLKTGPRRGQNRETPGEIIPLLAAIDDRVNHTVSVEKLSCVGPFGQFLADDLLRHARTREANQRSRFGQDDVSQVGE